MTVNVKLPLVISTSSWQPNVTWSNSSIPIAAAICRASLGLWLQDEVFVDYWNQWRRMGIPRAAYHFFMNDWGSADQAEFFVGCVLEAGNLLPGEKLIIDVEDNSGDYSISAVLDFLYNVKLLTGLDYEDMWIYSRANIMNPLSFAGLSQAQKDILLRVKQWPAGYPNDPNPYGFEDLKRFYQFDPLRYGPCVLVQYAASIEIPGINPIEGRSTECNVADPDYLAKWQAETGELPPPPTGDKMYQVTCTPYKVNVRATDGGTLGTDIGDLMPGQIGKGAEVAGSPTGAYYALHITEIDGVAVDGWVYARWNNSNTYATITEIAPPPPPPPANIPHLSAKLLNADGTVLATYEADGVAP